MNRMELRLRRVAMGLGQAELAKLLGVYQRTISEWESGRVVIRHPIILDRALRDLERELKERPNDVPA